MKTAAPNPPIVITTNQIIKITASISCQNFFVTSEEIHV
jgi:hypothetical protein